MTPTLIYLKFLQIGFELHGFDFVEDDEASKDDEENEIEDA